MWAVWPWRPGPVTTKRPANLQGAADGEWLGGLEILILEGLSGNEVVHLGHLLAPSVFFTQLFHSI